MDYTTTHPKTILELFSLLQPNNYEKLLDSTCTLKTCTLVKYFTTLISAHLQYCITCVANYTH